MNLVRRNACYSGIIRRFLGVMSYSTETTTATNVKDTLFLRVSRSGDPRTSMGPVIDRWRSEGKRVRSSDLHTIIKDLRKHRRYKHALQVSEWMSKNVKQDLTVADIAIRLDLISKVHGLVKAEQYFSSISDPKNGLQVYGALLNCYVHNDSLEKAETLTQKMRELGFTTVLSYNIMLRLYFKMGKHEKLDILMQKMKEDGLDYDIFTYNIRLKAYAAASDIQGMEKLLMEMENLSSVVDWVTYVIAANGYLKADMIDKASSMLKKSELLVTSKTRKIAYDVILTSYATLGKKDEVYRVWSLYKMSRLYNSSYLSMISSLVRLDDIEGAENIYKEWESHSSIPLDPRIPNVLVTAYFKKGLPPKAEELVNRLIHSGQAPNATTWQRLATGYEVNGQTEQAVEALKKAAESTGPLGWKLNPFLVAACLKYLKGKGKLEAAQEILTLLREKCHLSTKTYEALDSYVNNSEPCSLPLDQIEWHNNSQDEDTNEVMELNGKENC